MSPRVPVPPPWGKKKKEEEWEVYQETPLRAVIAFKSPLGLVMVLLGSGPVPEEEAYQSSSCSLTIYSKEQLEFAAPELDKSDFLDYFLCFNCNLD
ncbi:hypothetical protein Tco_0018880 [Tanacetum coccineum]